MFEYFEVYFHLNHVNELKQVELNLMMMNQLHVMIDSLLINRIKKINLNFEDYLIHTMWCH
jgi:hypothetical protein